MGKREMMQGQRPVKSKQWNTKKRKMKMKVKMKMKKKRKPVAQGQYVVSEFRCPSVYVRDCR